MMAEIREEQPAKAAVPMDSTVLHDIHILRMIFTVVCMYMSEIPGDDQRGQSGVKESSNPDGSHPPGDEISEDILMGTVIYFSFLTWK